MRHRSWRALLMGAVVFLLAAGSAHGSTTKTVKYGPFSVGAASSTSPAMATKLQLGVSRPCLDCYITSFHADLTDADGASVNMDDGAMLHHVVFASQFRSDATCSGTWLGLAGERFFASGNERTPVDLPWGYGYRVRWWDSWNMLVELMNMQQVTRSFYVTVTYTLRSNWESVRPVKPLWLDIDQCGDSEYAIPEGFSDTHRTWTSTMSGRVVEMIGHQHAWGVRVLTTNETRGGATICESDTMLDDMGQVMAMGPCGGTLPATIAQGDVLRLHSEYQSPAARTDVMGIMLGYVDRR